MGMQGTYRWRVSGCVSGCCSRGKNERVKTKPWAGMQSAGGFTLASQLSGTAFRAIAFPTASSSPDMTTSPFKAFCNSGRDCSMISMSLLYRIHSCTSTWTATLEQTNASLRTQFHEVLYTSEQRRLLAYGGLDIDCQTLNNRRLLGRLFRVFDTIRHVRTVFMLSS